MKTICSLLVGLIVVFPGHGQTQPGFAVNFVVPTDSTNLDGNTYSAGPDVAQPYTIRYQQVYAASEFSWLRNFRGGWLSFIDFRGDGTNGTQRGVKIPGIQVNVSTSQRGPDELSEVFAGNIGTDDMVVFAGSLQTYIIGGNQGSPVSFSSFQIPFSKLFYYDPTAGNLLLDIRVTQGDTNPVICNIDVCTEPRIDAWNRTNDSVSRVLWGDVNSSTGVVDSVGLVTQFFFWPNPKLNIQLQTNSVDLWWPANPTSFVFQTSQNLSPQTQWQSVTNDIVRSNAINTYKVFLDSAGTAAYFRLVSTTPP